ncbi:protein phosphatase methylesterase 1-like [Ruditapes philippinarum]|uniref:protein phosphatase methylesterase 1-like n=1 Tax=Ruditapes philippinarum TaxID=129788 RepID=UPI00295A885F|nr:protein phosphatase methylesterase 1-like [Ruditapes philippinarum]
MSDLQRQAIKHRIGGGLPPMPPPGVGGGKKKPIGRRRDYTPVYWDNYFEKELNVQVGENVFRVYECGTEGPVLLFLHGGGFSALSWAALCGSLSKLIACRCTAVDLRGHGDSVTTDETTLSADVLSSDVGDIVKELYGENAPPVILIGHSMGGAIAVHTGVRGLIPSLAGLVVIDVVEGTALEALSSMQNFLRGRPKVFKSLEQAIEWCVRSGQVRNVDSARVSMVGQVKRVDTNETASSELEHQHEDHIIHNASETIAEEEEEGGESTGQSSSTANQCSTQQKSDNEFKKPETPEIQYTWRIDLGRTEPYWRGWFEGLSNKFLSVEVPKLLLLAGVDRLDKDLTIGQMQGKFQMQVLPKSGHAVHEDVPEQVAEVLATFLVRNKMAMPTAHFQPTFPAC